MIGEARVVIQYAIISVSGEVESSLRWSDPIIGKSDRKWAGGVQFNEFSSLIDEALGRCLQNLVRDLQSGLLREALLGGDVK